MNRFMTIRGITTLLAITALALTTACAAAQKKGDEPAAKTSGETAAKTSGETAAKTSGETAATTAGETTAKAGGPAAEKLPESATCPVSKRSFKPNANTEKTVHNGKTYYFCCGGCTGKFAANPGQFTAADPAAAATPQPAKTADAKPCKGDCTADCADCANKAKSATK